MELSLYVFTKIISSQTKIITYYFNNSKFFFITLVLLKLPKKAIHNKSDVQTSVNIMF